jgi:hypothetical protein
MATEVVEVGPALGALSSNNLAGQASPTLPLRRFTCDEYYRMTKAGILGEDERIELIDGVIVIMAAQGGPHVTCVTKTRNHFLETLNEPVVVREEKPIDLGGSEPEPDLALAKGAVEDYIHHHPRPSDILLVVEVSETSLAYDRDVKGPLYAAAGIPEYWIIDLEHSQVQVYREPIPASATHGPQYRVHLTYFPGEVIAHPLFGKVTAEPGQPSELVVGIRVSELLP